MQLTRPRRGLHHRDASPIPFPAKRVGARGTGCSTAEQRENATADVIDALQSVSRNITDLARELKCLGFFDDSNDGRPRAA